MTRDFLRFELTSKPRRSEPDVIKEAYRATHPRTSFRDAAQREPKVGWSGGINGYSHLNLLMDTASLYDQLRLLHGWGASADELRNIASELDRLARLQEEYLYSEDHLPIYERRWTRPTLRESLSRRGDRTPQAPRDGVWPTPLPPMLDEEEEVGSNQIAIEDESPAERAFREKLWLAAHFGPPGVEPTGRIDDRGLLWLDETRAGRISRDGLLFLEISAGETTHEGLFARVLPDGTVREIVYPSGIVVQSADSPQGSIDPWERTIGSLSSDGTLKGLVPRKWLRDRRVTLGTVESGSLGAAAAWLLLHPSSPCSINHELLWGGLPLPETEAATAISVN